MMKSNYKSLALGFCLLLAACVNSPQQHGYNFAQNNISPIKIGQSSMHDVLHELGSPTSQSDFGDQVFYYISYKTDKVAFMEPQIIEQRVLAISFNKKNIVTDIHEYTMDNYKNIVFSKHRTEIHGSALTPMEQILSNIGKYNKQQKQF